MADGQGEEIERVAHLVGDAGGELSDHGELLRLFQLLFQLLPLAQLLHHLVEALHEHAYLVFAVLVLYLDELAFGYLLARLGDLLDGVGVLVGEDERHDDADAEGEKGAEYPLEVVPSLQGL